MNSDRIKEIQKTTGYPDSVSIQQALLQVWNECEQEKPTSEPEKALGLFGVSHSLFVDKIADKTTYIKGKEYDLKYKKEMIPVIEYNELKELAKEADSNCG